MAFFKRIEVWVLLALTVAGVVAVLRMDEEDGRGTRSRGDDGSVAVDGPGGVGDSSSGVTAPYWIESLNIERDGDHAVVEILVKSRSSDRDGETGGDSAPAARLLRADGSEVPSFFVPFQEVLDATGPLTSTQGRGLLFWADASSLAGALFLEVNGERLTVKSADDFRLEKIDDGARATLSVDGQPRADARAGGGAS